MKCPRLYALLEWKTGANFSFIWSSKYVPGAFQVHLRVRNFRISELEANLDTQEKSENDFYPKNTFDKIMSKNKRKGNCRS